MPPVPPAAEKTVDGTPVVRLNDDRIQVDDKVYSAKGLADFHPGGDLFVKVFAGLDATEAFLSYHRRKFPHSRVSKYLVGSATAKKNASADADYIELCGLVEQILPAHKSYAPWYYYLKVAFLLGAALYLEFYMHVTAQYKWYYTAPLGLLLALIGMNIQHDANHGSISRYPVINRL